MRRVKDLRKIQPGIRRKSHNLTWHVSIKHKKYSRIYREKKEFSNGISKKNPNRILPEILVHVIIMCHSENRIKCKTI